MKNLTIKNGIADVRQCPSPHYDDRPDPQEISLLVIHYISLPPEQFGAKGSQGKSFIDDFFQGKLDPTVHPYFAEIAEFKVSAHCLINRQGEITQYVNFNQRAWHAGVSSFLGRERCNDFSIGIELEGSDNCPFTNEQYESLVLLTHAIQQAYPQITKDRITGHCHIAPERKIDPGKFFDWQKYLQEL